MYVELHCHSYYSLLEGASSPEQLIARAVRLGMRALALTDRDTLAGAVPFWEAARARGLRPLLGAELTLDDAHGLPLLVADERGWRNLCTLISLGQHAAPKGQSRLPPDALTGRTDGLVALIGSRRSAVVAALRRRDRHAALAAARTLRDSFGPASCAVELEQHLLPDDDELNHELAGLAEHLGLPIVAANDVYYATRDDRRLQDVLVAIRNHTTLDAAGTLLRPNSEYYLKGERQLAPLFAAWPEALRAGREIAARCGWELRYGLQDLPRFETPGNIDAAGHLAELCRAGLGLRYGGTAPAAAEAQLARELQVIANAGLANYFLIVHDIVDFARSNGIRCQGRGSAANSLVAYLLGISPIDPLEHDLVFERFLSAERATTPDIDIDFAADRREEVIQYVYKTYGAEHAAMACTVVTFRARSALRDIGKVLGLPPGAIDAAERAEAEPGSESAARLMARERVDLRAAEADAHPDDPTTLLRELSRQIHRTPRHLGIHNGGMVLTGSPIADRVPTEPATMPGRVVVQWDKDALEAAGLVKIDILGLRMLSALADAETILREDGVPIELDRLRFDDPAVYELITSGETIGVFQVESRAQAQLQPRLRPSCFNDLIVAISLIRPGPIQGQMVHPYLRRRDGIDPVTYLHSALRPALEETLGVILFQEQVLKVARDVAGFSPGQGEQLRRALGSKDAAERLKQLRPAFLAGALARDIPADAARAIFGQLAAFAGYSFPKSHAAAFAVLVYQSAYLKLYHPAAFFAALLNNQPMGFWPPGQLIADARRRGVHVLGLDVQRSRGRCRARGHKLRLGLLAVDGWGEAAVERLIGAREQRRSPAWPTCAAVRSCREDWSSG